MNGQETIDFFETIVEDSLDQTAALILLNNAKNKVEGEYDLEILKTLDASQSASSAAKPLPANYNRTIGGILYVNNQPYRQVPFEQQKALANSGLRWYLDMKNSNYYLLGSNLSGTINHFYIYQTDDITLTTSAVWPARFHPLLAFEMAELFYAIDQGDRGRAWDDKWAIQHALLKRSLVDWDTKLKKYAEENAVPMDQDSEYPLSMM